MGKLTKPVQYASQDVLRYVFPVRQVPEWTVDSVSGENETIDVPGYSNAQLSDGYAQFLAGLPAEQAAEQASEQAEVAEVLQMFENTQTSLASPGLLSVSGRQYLRRNTWYTGADDLYGFAYYQFAENAGRGSTPTLEWEHMGVFLEAGQKLGKFRIAGRANNTSVTDVQMYIVLRYPDSPTRWETGYDRDDEMDFTLLYNDLFANPSVGTPFSGGNMGDMRRRIIDLDHTVQQDCFFSIYMRPVTTNNNTRYFYHNWTLEVS